MPGIDLSEVYALAHDIERNAGEVDRKAELIVARTAFRTVQLAQGNAPVDTGALKSSIGADVDGLSFEAGPTVEYGGFVEEGTHGPYPIPNAFGWGITVMHPGNSPRPYLAPAFDAALEPAVRAFADLGTQILGQG